MSDEQLSRKTDEIIKGIRLLLDKSYSYNKAMTLHCKKIRNSNINKKDIFSFDRVIENTMNS